MYTCRVSDGDGNSGPTEWPHAEDWTILANDAQDALQRLERRARKQAATCAEYEDGGQITLYVYSPDDETDSVTIDL